jgi:hypothetical protein
VSGEEFVFPSAGYCSGGWAAGLLIPAGLILFIAIRLNQADSEYR